MQIDRELAKISESEPPRDYAVVRCVQAWCDLSTCRPVGMVVGVIPWTSIVTWCQYQGFDKEATDVMLHVIRQLDADRAEAEAKDAQVAKASGGERGRSRR